MGVGHVSNNNHNKPKPNEPTLQNDLEAMKNALTKLAGDSSPTTPIIDDNPLLKPEFLNRNHDNNSNNNNNKTSNNDSKIQDLSQSIRDILNSHDNSNNNKENSVKLESA